MTDGRHLDSRFHCSPHRLSGKPGRLSLSHCIFLHLEACHGEDTSALWGCIVLSVERLPLPSAHMCLCCLTLAQAGELVILEKLCLLVGTSHYGACDSPASYHLDFHSSAGMRSLPAYEQRWQNPGGGCDCVPSKAEFHNGCHVCTRVGILSQEPAFIFAWLEVRHHLHSREKRKQTTQYA